MCGAARRRTRRRPTCPEARRRRAPPRSRSSPRTSHAVAVTVGHGKDFDIRNVGQVPRVTQRHTTGPDEADPAATHSSIPLVTANDYPPTPALRPRTVNDSTSVWLGIWRPCAWKPAARDGLRDSAMAQHGAHRSDQRGSVASCAAARLWRHRERDRHAHPGASQTRRTCCPGNRGREHHRGRREDRRISHPAIRSPHRTVQRGDGVAAAHMHHVLTWLRNRIDIDLVHDHLEALGPPSWPQPAARFRRYCTRCIGIWPDGRRFTAASKAPAGYGSTVSRRPNWHGRRPAFVRAVSAMSTSPPRSLRTRRKGRRAPSVTTLYWSPESPRSRANMSRCGWQSARLRTRARRAGRALHDIR